MIIFCRMPDQYKQTELTSIACLQEVKRRIASFTARDDGLDNIIYFYNRQILKYKR